MARAERIAVEEHLRSSGTGIWSPGDPRIAGEDQMDFLRAELTAGSPRRASSPGSIDIDEAAGLFTVVMSGLIALQLANEPGDPMPRSS